MNVPSRRTGFARMLSSLNCDGAYGVALATACVALLLPELGGEGLRAAWRYERAGLSAGELWRLVTAHIVHLDLEHAALNALGVVLMWALFARDFRPRAWLAILVASAIAIDTGLWFRDTSLDWYVGASGVLHGAMAAGTLAHLRRRDLDGWILTAFVCAKLAWEQWGTALPFAEGDAHVVVNAHLYGALGGLAVALVILGFEQRGGARSGR